MTPSFAKILSLGLAAAVAAACSSTPVRTPPCPEILIPADSAELTRFKSESGRDIVDVLHEEKILGFAHRCTFDTDDTGAGEVVVEVAPQLQSSIGPASTDNTARFAYFVAIADADKTILEKARFPVEIPFPQNRSRVEWQREEPIVLRLPLEAGQSPTDYRIFLGLQLTREELEYQRESR